MCELLEEMQYVCRSLMRVRYRVVYVAIMGRHNTPKWMYVIYKYD